MNKYRYITYLGRDRDDWDANFVYAPNLEIAIEKAHDIHGGTGYTVKRGSFKLVDNQ